MNKSSVISKATKLLMLTRSDNKHESENALHKLNGLLKKHDLKIEDIELEIKTETKQFRIGKLTLFELLVQIALKVLCIRNLAGRNSYYDKEQMIGYIDLTEIEYIYINAYYQYFKGLYLSELSAFLRNHIFNYSKRKLDEDDFKIAFYTKHKLFADIKVEGPPPEYDEDYIMEIHRIIKWMKPSQFNPYKAIA